MFVKLNYKNNKNFFNVGLTLVTSRLTNSLGYSYWPEQFQPIRAYWPKQFKPIRGYWPELFWPITLS